MENEFPCVLSLPHIIFIQGIGGTDRRYRLQRVIETIEHYDPDILFLQEVDDNVPRSRYDCQYQKLSTALDFPYHAYQRNVHLKQGAYGNAILSRFALHDICHLDLTVPMKKRRRALWVRCKLTWKKHSRTLLLANTHLGLSGIERQIQLRRILKSPALLHTAERTPIIVSGDFNDV